jgi:hypothetical protein
MAKILLDAPVAAIGGSISKHQNVIYRTRNGRTHAYVVTHPNELPQSETQKRNSSAFGAISKQVHAEMSDPIKRAEWEKSFAEYTKKHNPSYKRSESSNDHHPYSSRRKSVITTLYGYIFHTLHERSKSNSPSANS